MGNDFDPFGGSGKDYYSGSNNKKSKGNPIMTVILIIAIIGIGIYYGSSFLTLKKIDVTFKVTNTENESIPATIRISTDPMMSNIIETFSNNETKKISAKNYYYNVQSSGYIGLTKKALDLKGQKSTKTELVELEKNISLKISNIVFPEKVYAGQTAILKIFYENTSPTKSYSLDDLVIGGDINGWPYTSVDYASDPVTDVVLYPQTKDTIYLKYTIEDTKSKTNDIKVRVKYKKDEKTKEFSIIEEPTIPITGKLTKEITSGDNANFSITISNSKNKIPIPDLTISLEVNGQNNNDVNSWFTYPQGNILVSASKNETKTVSISVPQTATNDTIEGNLIFDSSIFREPKTLPINITITEPNINFNTSLNKKNVNLTYDVNNNVTNIEYVTITLDNKSSIDIDLLDIKVLDLDPIKNDCNNFIYFSENAFPDMKVISNTKPELPITITAIDPTQIGDLINNTRMCNIVIEYRHPFRPSETVMSSNNFSITVEEKQ